MYFCVKWIKIYDKNVFSVQEHETCGRDALKLGSVFNFTLSRQILNWNLHEVRAIFSQLPC